MLLSRLGLSELLISGTPGTCLHLHNRNRFLSRVARSARVWLGSMLRRYSFSIRSSCLPGVWLFPSINHAGGVSSCKALLISRGLYRHGLRGASRRAQRSHGPAQPFRHGGISRKRGDRRRLPLASRSAQDSALSSLPSRGLICFQSRFPGPLCEPRGFGAEVKRKARYEKQREAIKRRRRSLF